MRRIIRIPCATAERRSEEIWGMGGRALVFRGNLFQFTAVSVNIYAYGSRNGWLYGMYVTDRKVRRSAFEIWKCSAATLQCLGGCGVKTYGARTAIRNTSVLLSVEIKA